MRGWAWRRRRCGPSTRRHNAAARHHSSTRRAVAFERQGASRDACGGAAPPRVPLLPWRSKSAAQPYRVWEIPARVAPMPAVDPGVPRDALGTTVIAAALRWWLDELAA